jgi:hypothetical protein
MDESTMPGISPDLKAYAVLGELTRRLRDSLPG